MDAQLDSLPPPGYYYDFINRLWQQNPKTERFGRKILFSADKNKKPKLKPKKGKNFQTVTPLCRAGYRMVYWGFCSSSTYGRCIYTKPGRGIRLYPPVPRGTEKYKKTYNSQTGSERVNNRILNHYHLHDMRIHGKKRYSFFAMIAGINIHLDARIKVTASNAA